MPQVLEERGRIRFMDGDSSEDDCNFTTVIFENKRMCLAHLERKKSVRCAFLRFRRMRP